MTFEGMTPDQIDQAASQLRTQSRELTFVRSKVNSLVNSASTHWQGNDMRAFTSSWNGTYSKQLARAVTQLDTMADTLVRQANDQRNASKAAAFIGPTPAKIPIIPPANPLFGGGSWKNDPTLWGADPFPPDVIQNDPLTPGEVQQGNLGDCWLVATLMAMMETEEGRQSLRDGVVYNSSTNSYKVRLYILGIERWVTVTNPAANGVQLSNGSQGIVSLYEAAFLQQFGPKLLIDDSPAVGIPVFGDKMPHIHWDAGPLHAKISDDAVASGGSADGGISVALSPDSFNGQNDIAITATSNPSTGQATVPIRIDANHAYEVVDIQNGMIGLRNPHGPGNSYDWNATNADGVFYITQEDFDKVFSWEFQT